MNGKRARTAFRRGAQLALFALQLLSAATLSAQSATPSGTIGSETEIRFHFMVGTHSDALTCATSAIAPAPIGAFHTIPSEKIDGNRGGAFDAGSEPMVNDPIIDRRGEDTELMALKPVWYKSFHTSRRWLDAEALRT